MQFLNPVISRIVIHQIYKKNKDEKLKEPPFKGTELTNFEDSAMRNFTKRYDEAIGENSRAIEMLIDLDRNDAVIQNVIKSIHDSDDDFIDSSFEIAKKLDKAQDQPIHKQGIVVVFTGTCNYPVREFLGIIKAETHSGYEKIKNPKTGKISLKFIEEVLLTPGTKLYKSVAFLKKIQYNPNETNLNKNWEVWVSDSQVNKAEGKAAAAYFLEKFLGFVYPQTSSRKTKIFYDTTLQYIQHLDIEQEKKNDYLNALTTYLKVDKSNIIDPIDFSEKYFDKEDNTGYLEHLEQMDIETTSFVKDIENIKSKLKIRKLSFNGNIKIIGSPEEFKDKVSFEPIDGEPDKHDNIPKWTKIIIKDVIKSQE
ncbi:nucleoid-associated protein [Marinomonas posidonica]|uniref:nucleoid-associated protein n=1 Tax=Marinomonas posidonica TaxID=936476 RepID=UPI00373605FA